MTDTHLTYTDWMARRHTWVRALSQDDLRRVINQVEQNEGSLRGGSVSQAMDAGRVSERLKAEALLWLATRGQEGNDWGIPAVWAVALGLWPSRET